MPHDVFISHSEKDKIFADATCAALESHGVRCWIAPRDVLPGTEWSEAIVEAIEQCRLMVLVFSSHANSSKFVKNEVERAVSRGICVIPIRIEDVPMTKSLELFVSTRHWLDAMTAPLQAHLDRLSETVHTLLGATVPLSGEAADLTAHAIATGVAAGTHQAASRPMNLDVVVPNRLGLRSALEYSVVAVLFWILSTVMQDMSGPALSVPASWRYMVRVISAALAVVIFGFMRQQVSVTDFFTKRRRNWTAFLAVGVAAAFLIAFKVVSSICIIHWDSRDWLTQELKMDASRPTLKTASGREHQFDANANVDTFLDTDDGDLYVPLVFPSPQRDYLNKVSRAYGEDGLTWELNNEPDKVIDWLRGPCRGQLQLTTAVFFALHIGTICSLAIGLTLAYGRREAILKRFMG
jgi:hypothetical protein